jgi:cytidylate kinase
MGAFLRALPDGIAVVVDEAYIEFVRDPDCTSRIHDTGPDSPLAVLRTFSKAYGLAGLRIGYGVMAPFLADALHRVRQPFNASLLAQAGALAALDDVDFLRRSVALVHEGLDSLQRGLDRMGLPWHPTQANFFLVDLERDADGVFQEMLRQGVIVRSMAEYGFPTCIRINAGLPEENRRFLEALEKVVSAGKGPLFPERDLLITIDGPAGAGKTTVSRMLADRLGYRYVDTGALYRAVALAAKEAGLSPDDDDGLGKLLEGLELDYGWTADGGAVLRLDGGDVTARLRTPEVTRFASAASARPVVRAFLLDLQRRLGRNRGAVFEGRDMGTVVFPDADVKFFLDADPAVRAQRRHRELAGAGGPSLEQVRRDMARRDADDSRRALAPLKAADDALRVDSTGKSAEEVVEGMVRSIPRGGSAAAGGPSKK